ncbi:MAG TPA: hypothetical protein VKA53_01420 [Thermoanaerobaculia bacterium]|nr:hypothetical protein [Thermoanaerobaculia bacterium]
MAKRNPADRAKRGRFSPDPKDKKVERAVLAFLVFHHPERLTIPELSRALSRENSDLESDDAVERAVRELVGVGLLECQAGVTLPTRAALYFDALESD